MPLFPDIEIYGHGYKNGLDPNSAARLRGLAYEFVAQLALALDGLTSEDDIASGG